MAAYEIITEVTFATDLKEQRGGEEATRQVVATPEGPLTVSPIGEPVKGLI